jgi:hypothetical protein
MVGGAGKHQHFRDFEFLVQSKANRAANYVHLSGYQWVSCSLKLVFLLQVMGINCTRPMQNIKQKIERLGSARLGSVPLPLLVNGPAGVHLHVVHVHAYSRHDICASTSASVHACMHGSHY